MQKDVAANLRVVLENVLLLRSLRAYRWLFQVLQATDLVSEQVWCICSVEHPDALTLALPYYTINQGASIALKLCYAIGHSQHSVFFFPKHTTFSSFISLVVINAYIYLIVLMNIYFCIKTNLH